MTAVNTLAARGAPAGRRDYRGRGCGGARRANGELGCCEPRDPPSQRSAFSAAVYAVEHLCAPAAPAAKIIRGGQLHTGRRPCVPYCYDVAPLEVLDDILHDEVFPQACRFSAPPAAWPRRSRDHQGDRVAARLCSYRGQAVLTAQPIHSSDERTRLAQGVKAAAERVLPERFIPALNFVSFHSLVFLFHADNITQPLGMSKVFSKV